MTFREACDRLPEYVAGELPAAQRAELERMLTADPELQRMLQVSTRLERVLERQEWLAPRVDFTVLVLARIEQRAEVVPARVQVWERLRTWLSLAALLPLLILYGHTAWSWSVAGLQGIANRLDSLTGVAIFGLHPIILVGLVAPILAGCLAGCVLTGRCRLSS